MNLSLLYNIPGPEAGPDDLDSIEQVRAVGSALADLGHDAEELPVPENMALFRKMLRDRRERLFFNLIDPLAGEGRFIAMPVLALEQEGCGYTGCTADSLYMISNKLLAKRLMILAGIPTPFWVVRKDDPGGPEKEMSFVPGLYLIKSIWEHGSSGMTPDSVFSAESRKKAESRLSNEPRGCFAEVFLPGREINIGLLAGGSGGWDILPPSEILYKDPGSHPFLDYSSKWNEDSASYRMSPRTLEVSEDDRLLIEQMDLIAKRCINLFGLNGYARVDFRLNAAGQPMVMEVNANPSLTPGAGFAAEAERGGIAYPEMISRIVEAPAYGL